MPIRILSQQLINQISAGEVVERPSSIVKELVENSLDAGATSIDINVENGGCNLIMVRDNGIGILKNDLVLALSNHATSKITSLEDLENIVSLGFRGEALASIRSVSRLTLTSRTKDQNEAWQLYTEGHDISVTLKPTAHPIGTTLELLDLFYNTPARLKFMRTERTEFSHIDEIVRRLALSRFDVSISLKHNGKMIRQYRGAVNNNLDQKNRLNELCGRSFVHNAYFVQYKHNELSLKGWLSTPVNNSYNHHISNIQYSYVNGRIVRDKTIRHAVYQAYQVCNKHVHNLTDLKLQYILYLKVDPKQVDINVHPSKNEVRFHQSGLIHDFIFHSIINTLQNPTMIDYSTLNPIVKNVNCKLKNREVAGTNYLLEKENQLKLLHKNFSHKEHNDQLLFNSLRKPPVYFTTPTKYVDLNESLKSKIDNLNKSIPVITNIVSFGRVLTVIRDNYALLESGKDIQLLSLAVALMHLKQVQLRSQGNNPSRHRLLIPIRLKIIDQTLLNINIYEKILHSVGIDLQKEKDHIVLYSIPTSLRKQNLQIFIKDLFYVLKEKIINTDSLIKWLCCCSNSMNNSWNKIQATALLSELEEACPHLLNFPPACLIQKIDINNLIKALINE